ncbi:MAG: hypothetical protein ACI8T1_003461 [Verrucomicrobiales bacterium]|jgi:hypothetical protein
MGCLLTLFVFAAVPLLWLYPRVGTVVTGAGWVLLLLVVYSGNRRAKFTTSGGVLTESEAELASKYGFYFSMPHASINLSNGAAPWQIFSLLWLGFLGFHHHWWYMTAPLVVIVICIYLRASCHPGLFADQGAEQHSGTALGREFEIKSARLQSILDKLWGDGATWEDESDISD